MSNPTPLSFTQYVISLSDCRPLTLTAPSSRAPLYLNAFESRLTHTCRTSDRSHHEGGSGSTTIPLQLFVPLNSFNTSATSAFMSTSPLATGVLPSREKDNKSSINSPILWLLSRITLSRRRPSSSSVL